MTFRNRSLDSRRRHRYVDDANAPPENVTPDKSPMPSLNSPIRDDDSVKVPHDRKDAAAGQLPGAKLPVRMDANDFPDPTHVRSIPPTSGPGGSPGIMPPISPVSGLSGTGGTSMRPPPMPPMPSTPSMPATPTTPAGLPTPTTAANDLSQGFTKGLSAGAANPLPPSVPTAPQTPTPPPAATQRHPRIRSGLRVAARRTQRPRHQPHAATRPGSVTRLARADDRRLRHHRNLASFGSDLPRSATPPTPSTPTVSAGGGGGGAPLPPGTASAGISSNSVSPSVLAASGIAATGTGAAMVSSETQDQHLDEASATRLRASACLPHLSRLALVRRHFQDRYRNRDRHRQQRRRRLHSARGLSYPVQPECFSPIPN